MAKLPKSKGASKAGAAQVSASDALIEPFADALSTMTDEEAAQQAGVSVRAVAAYRKRHADDEGDDDGDDDGDEVVATPGQAPVKFRRSKIDPFIDIVGKLPDREVAKRAKVTLNAVRNYRTNRGIPSSRTWARTQREQASKAARAPAPVAAAPVSAPVPAREVARELEPVSYAPEAASHTVFTRMAPTATYAWRARFEGGVEGILTAANIQEASRLAMSHDQTVIAVERLGRLL